MLADFSGSQIPSPEFCSSRSVLMCAACRAGWEEVLGGPGGPGPCVGWPGKEVCVCVHEQNSYVLCTETFLHFVQTQQQKHCTPKVTVHALWNLKLPVQAHVARSLLVAAGPAPMTTFSRPGCPLLPSADSHPHLEVFF